MKKGTSLQIGNFGGSLEQIDGQTIKTVMFSLLLNDIHKKNIKIDIYNYTKIQFFLLYLTLPFYILRAKYVYIGLGKRGMLTFAPWVIFLSLIFRRKIIYYVIGGWFFDFLSNKKKIIFLYKKFDSILVELPSMISIGKSLGINNIYFFPNFRHPNSLPKIKKTLTGKLDLIFYSRVIKEKGIRDAISAVQMLTDDGFNISLDIFGPLIDESLIEKINPAYNIQYKGVLNPLSENLYNIINKYDILIFPTYYKGEGFPGAIIDAFIAGVPVLATNWKYNSEIVNDGINGGLFPPKDIKMLYEKIKFYYETPLELDTQKNNAQLDSYKYSFSNAKAILESLI